VPDKQLVLSEREREILRLVATGAANKEIAYRLHISPNTVKVHLRNIFEKIGVTSRIEAAMYAVREGIAEAGTATSVLMEKSEGGSARQAWWRWAGAVSGLVGVLALSVAAALLARLILAPQPRPTAVISVLSPSPTPVLWLKRAAMPVARSGLTAVGYEDQVLAIGGTTPQGLTGVVELYDPRTDQWQTRASKPLPVADVSAAEVAGRIFVPGGRLASGELTGALEIYDPHRDVWTLGAPLPEALSRYALAAFEGKLYLFGGWNGTAYVASVFEYDPDLNTWSVRASLPSARGSAGAAATSGGVLVVGGFDGQRALPSTLEYIPEEDASGASAWRECAPLPEPRFGMAVASSGDLVHLLGGQSEDVEELAPLEYVTQRDEWRTLTRPDMRDWKGMGLVQVGTSLVAVGGETGGQVVGTTLTYQVLYTIAFPLVR
jgi:DNA-binding CsgD family transcriptional regulator